MPAGALAVGAEVVLRLIAPALRSVGFFRKVFRMANGVAQIHGLVAQMDAGRSRDFGMGGVFFAEGHR